VEGRDDGLAGAAARPALLDVAGGTGDVAFRFLKRAPGASAVVCDMTEAMLIEGRKRAEAEKPGRKPGLGGGRRDGAALPVNSFDVYTISFGIRNVTRIPTRWPRPTACCAPAGG
jgi:demethylmenaquinone methyltransferase/2-methoxy-6-polyprenyl-1,4-benzoquinol methylase